MFQVCGFCGFRNFRIAVLAVGLFLSVLQGRAWGIGLNDVSTWFGSGTAEAGFVIDWNDSGGTQTHVFGYRYDALTSPTAEDALIDVAGTMGSNLYLRVGVVGNFGLPLYGVGYDANSSGFGLSDPTVFVDGVAVTGPSDTAAALDAGDYYAEGWQSNGFWEVFFGVENTGWTSAFTGITGASLTEGEWIGLSFAPLFLQSAPSVSLLVPEPGSALVLMLGGALLGLWRGGSGDPGHGHGHGHGRSRSCSCSHGYGYGRSRSCSCSRGYFI